MAQFVISTVSLLALYILVLGLLPRVRDRLGDTAFVSIPLLIAFGLTIVHFVRKSGLPLQSVRPRHTKLEPIDSSKR
jgi:hypothetical protein